MKEYQRNDALKNIVVSDDFKDIPIIDIKTYIEASQEQNQWTNEASLECQKVVECFHKFGILLIFDPTVKEYENEAYLDTMEEYFAKTAEMYYKGKEL